jgi:hypothetical protein
LELTKTLRFGLRWSTTQNEEPFAIPIYKMYFVYPNKTSDKMQRDVSPSYSKQNM